MERKNLLIVGAGGFGREVFEWAAQSLDFGSEWKFRGFLDDNRDALEGKSYPAGVLSGIGEYVPEPRDYFLCAVGNPEMKERLVSVMLEKGVKPATLVHRSVIIGRNVVLGEGVILCPNVVLTSDILIGRYVSLNIGTAVGHDAVLGDFVQSSAFCDLTGGVKLGRGVFLGSRATVLPKVEVGDGAVIGAGSVVVGNVKAGETVFGVPAMRLRKG